MLYKNPLVTRNQKPIRDTPKMERNPSIILKKVITSHGREQKKDKNYKKTRKQFNKMANQFGKTKSVITKTKSGNVNRVYVPIKKQG